MPTRQEVIDRYAALVVEVGANVQPGQTVVVTADVARARTSERSRWTGCGPTAPSYRSSATTPGHCPNAADRSER